MSSADCPIHCPSCGFHEANFETSSCGRSAVNCPVCGYHRVTFDYDDDGALTVEGGGHGAARYYFPRLVQASPLPHPVTAEGLAEDMSMEFALEPAMVRAEVILRVDGHWRALTFWPDGRREQRSVDLDPPAPAGRPVSEPGQLRSDNV